MASKIIGYLLTLMFKYYWFFDQNESYTEKNILFSWTESYIQNHSERLKVYSP